MLGLVLGGGAAKGYAHIGVLKYLEEIAIKPDLVVGASMGALVGGYYAAGYNVRKIEEYALQITKRKKRKLFSLHPSRFGLVNGREIIRFLQAQLGNRKIQELPMKYAAVATDIENFKEIIINSGDLVHAIRASISIPVFFVPHLYLDNIYIDGGFVSPVPVQAAIKLGATKIIAVNVLRRFAYPIKELVHARKSHGPESGDVQKDDNRSHADASQSQRQKNQLKEYHAKRVFSNFIALATSRLIDYQQLHIKDGLMINIKTKGIGLSQFEKARQAIALGYKQAKNYPWGQILNSE